MFKLYLIKCAWLTLPTVSHTDTWAVLTPPVPCYSNLCQFLSLLFSLNPSSCPFPFFFFFLSPPNVHLSQDSPPLDSRCCYCYTCTTHRPSFLPLHSASPAAQVLPSHPHLILSHLHPLTLCSFCCLPVLFCFTFTALKKPHNPPFLCGFIAVVVCFTVVCRKIHMSYTFLHLATCGLMNALNITLDSGAP